MEIVATTMGNTEVTEAILDRVYEPPPEVEYYTALFLKALARPPGVTPMKAEEMYISAEEHAKAWKKQPPNPANFPTQTT